MRTGPSLRSRYFFDSRSILVLSNVINVILGIVIIGLTAHNLQFVRSNDAKDGSTLIAWNVTLGEIELPQTRTIDYLPEDIRLGSYWLMLSWGIGAFLLYSAVGGLLAWRHASVWREEHNTGEINDINKSPQTPLSLVIALIALCWSIAATTYAFVEWSNSGTFLPSDNLYLVNGRYSSARGQGFFTPDSWFCQYEDYIVDANVQNTLENYCAEGTTIRILTLVSTVLGLALLIAMIYRNNRRTRVAMDAEYAREQHEEEQRVPRGRSRTRDPPAERVSMAPTVVADEKSDLAVDGDSSSRAVSGVTEAKVQS